MVNTSNGKPPSRFKAKPGSKGRRTWTTGITVKPKEGPNGEPDWSHIAPRVLIKRQQFVHEYVKDMNATAACSRLGWVYAYPAIKCNEILREPYTQWYLAKFLATCEDSAIITRTQVLLGLREEAFNKGDDASSLSRIAAFRALAKMMGWEITRMEGNITLHGGVMKVPVVGNLEEWENQSTKQQEQLKLAVRV
jgi:phage terminase small subunit